MKNNKSLKPVRKSTYALLVRSEENNRGIFETFVYGMLVLSAVIGIWQVAQVRQLPDADDRAQDEHAVNEGLKNTAIVFFRPDEQSVGRFPNWFKGFVVFHKVALSLCNARATHRNKVLRRCLPA